VSGVVLDASAMLAVLRGENGAQKVIASLADAAISTVNLAEVVGALTRDGVSPPEIQAMLEGFPAEVIVLDRDLAFDAGLLLPLTRAAGLSLGDRVCLALARRRSAAALTGDRAWMWVADAVGVEVELIR
jgi:PIN domain nuclease of toxin-antitoxin system